MAGVVLDEQSCVRDLDDREFFLRKLLLREDVCIMIIIMNED